MTYKKGDRVRIVSKSNGAFSFEKMKQCRDCPNLDDSIVSCILRDTIRIGNYNFREEDLRPVDKMSKIYNRLLLKNI